MILKPGLCLSNRPVTYFFVSEPSSSKNFFTTFSTITCASTYYCFSIINYPPFFVDESHHRYFLPFLTSYVTPQLLKNSCCDHLCRWRALLLSLLLSAICVETRTNRPEPAQRLGAQCVISHSFQLNFSCKGKVLNIETTSMGHLMIEQLLVSHALPGVPEHIGEDLRRLVLDMINAIWKDVENYVFAILEILAVRTAHNLMNSGKFVSQFSDAFTDTLDSSRGRNTSQIITTEIGQRTFVEARVNVVSSQS